MKYFFIFSIVLGSFLFFGAKAEAATWYVSTTGTDDASHGTGTGVDAWKTLNYALTGQRVSMGDTIFIEEGTYDTFYSTNTKIVPDIATTTGSGAVSVEAYPENANVTLDMPTNTSSVYAFLYLSSSNWTEILFKNINFTNSNSVDSTFIWLYGHNVTFLNCIIDLNHAGRLVFVLSNDTETSELSIKRSIIRNSATGRAFVTNGRTDGIIPTINIESSVFHGGSSTYLSLLNPASTTIINNTFYLSNDREIVAFQNSGGEFNSYNNIYYSDNGLTTAPIRFYTGTADEYYLSNPNNWNVESNIWYNPNTSPYTSSYPVFYVGSISFKVDGSNHFLDPIFTSTSTPDFSLNSLSPACGHGNTNHLPSDGDLNEDDWFGGDVGAYKCSNDDFNISLQDKVAFAGDSILTSATAPDYFTSLTGIDHSDTSLAAWSGGTIQRLFSTIDGLMVSDSPDTVFVSIGINNIVSDYPDEEDNTTSQEYASYIAEIMEKIQDWGATPIWLGIGSANNYGSLPDTGIIAINDELESICDTRGWKCGSYLNQMMNNPLWQSASPDGYYDADGNVHPNTAGKQLIAALSEYLYYPKYTIITDDVQYTGSIKIYRDGKYRYSTATSTASTANFRVTPAEGSFGTGNYSEWLNISNMIWDVLGNKNKQWTASSSVATSTIYTIGDLLPNTYYTFKLDGTASNTAIVDNDQCTDGVCLSDSNGQIVFTYQGGYSTHTFALEKDVTGPSTFTLSSPDNNSSVPTRPTLSWNATSDSESGLAKYQLYINGSLNRDNISASATSITPQSDLTCGSYTWFIRAIDNAGNTTDSDTRNMALLCGSVSVSNPTSLTTFQTYDPTTDKTTTGTAPKQTTPDAGVPADSNIPSTGTNEPDTESTWNQILSEGGIIAKGNINQLLTQTGQTRDLTAETNYSQTIVENIVQGTGTSEQTRNAITNFVTYGTQTTQILGAGERAGVVNSFKSAFGKLPETETDWQDVIKIANGRWPGQANTETEKNAEVAFRKIYLRNPDRTNPNDDAAITVMAYGLRPANRNLESEKRAIGFFTAIYGYSPKTATAWDVVRAIAYSGAKR